MQSLRRRCSDSGLDVLPITTSDVNVNAMEDGKLGKLKKKTSSPGTPSPKENSAGSNVKAEVKSRQKSPLRKKNFRIDSPKSAKKGSSRTLFPLVLVLVLMSIAITAAKTLFSGAVLKYTSSKDKIQKAEKDQKELAKKNEIITEQYTTLTKANSKLEQKYKTLEKQKEDLKKLYGDLQTKQKDMVQKTVMEETVRQERSRVEKEIKENGAAELEALKSSIQKDSQRQVIKRFGKTYGSGPFKVEFQVELPNQPANVPSARYFTIETASLEEMPHSINIFLQQVEEKLWDGCSFPIHTGQTVIARPGNKLKDFESAMLESVSFDEYSSNYPHKEYTIGFITQSGLPEIYLNTKIYSGPTNEKVNHPGFGRVVSGSDVIDMIASIPSDADGQLRRKVTIRRVYII